MGARYYAPWLGRWTTADPLGLQAGVNLYLYGRASPVVMVDPNGMEPVRVTDDDRAIGRALAGVGRTLPLTSGAVAIADLAFGRGKVEAAGAGSAKFLAERGEGIAKTGSVAASLSAGPVGWVSGALSHEGGVTGYLQDAGGIAAGVASAPVAAPSLLGEIGKGIVDLARDPSAEGVGYHGTSIAVNTVDLLALAAGVASEATALAKSVEAGAVSGGGFPVKTGLRAGGSGGSGGGGTGVPGGGGAGAGGTTVQGFIGGVGEKILDILDSGTTKPGPGGRIFVGGTPESTYFHGADVTRKAAFSIQVELQVPGGASVVRTGTPGVDRTTVIHSSEPISTQVQKMHVRTKNPDAEVGGFETSIIEGAEAIRNYLTKPRNQ